MLKDFVFVYDRNGDGREVETMGRLSTDGQWEGEQALEFDVRKSIRNHNLDLEKQEDRDLFLLIHSGTFVFAVEEDPKSPEILD
jgi:hypothetical protein